jgi:hypothetical protein
VLRSRETKVMAALLSFDRRRSIGSWQLSNQSPFPFLGHIPSRVMISSLARATRTTGVLGPGTTLSATYHFVDGCSETATPFSDT